MIPFQDGDTEARLSLAHQYVTHPSIWGSGRLGHVSPAVSFGTHWLIRFTSPRLRKYLICLLQYTNCMLINWQLKVIGGIRIY